MLKPTEEMVMALWRQLPSEVQDGREPDDIRGWVAYVLAIVERDNQVHPLCTATLGTGMRCEYEAGMAHPDEHSARAPGGSRVRWS